MPEIPNDQPKKRRPTTWQQGEKSIAKQLGGERLNRQGYEKFIAAPDVIFPAVPFIKLDNKERRKFALHKIFEDTFVKYCKKEDHDQLILTTHTYKSKRRYATVDAEFMKELLDVYLERRGYRSMKLAFLTKEFEFEYGHRLDGYAGGAKNTCGNPSGHGHSGILQVTVRGPIDEVTGMVVDFKELSTIVKEKIIAKLDHSFLNVDVPEIGRPTAENIIYWMFDQLIESLPQLYAIKMWETRSSFSEITIDEYKASKAK